MKLKGSIMISVVFTLGTAILILLGFWFCHRVAMPNEVETLSKTSQEETKEEIVELEDLECPDETYRIVKQTMEDGGVRYVIETWSREHKYVNACPFAWTWYIAWTPIYHRKGCKASHKTLEAAKEVIDKLEAERKSVTVVKTEVMEL